MNDQGETGQDKLDLYWDIWLSHWRSFLQCVRMEWEGVFALAKSLALVLGMRCKTCGKVRRVLWMPSGNHNVCGRLTGWGQDETRPQ